jgi:glutaredoxin 3
MLLMQTKLEGEFMIDPELDAIRKRKLNELIKEREAKGLKKVIVYSTRTCPYCVMAKEYLSSKNIAFEDVDVGSDRARAQEMINKTGQMGVPVLDIGGTIIIGFDRPAIDAALSS